MVITKREDVTKQGFCKILWRKLCLLGSLLLELIQENLLNLGGGGWEWESGWGGGGRFIEFELDRKGGGVGWALIRGWALINFFCL